MNIEPGDVVQLYSSQVNGCYLDGGNWMPHSARPGRYEVLDVQGETVLLGIRRNLDGGTDIFRCSMQGLRAVVLDDCHYKPSPASFTVENSGLADRIYTRGPSGEIECAAEVVNSLLSHLLVSRANTAIELAH